MALSNINSTLLDVKLSEMIDQNNRLEKVWRQLYQSDFSQNKLIGEIDYQRPLQLFDPTKLLNPKINPSEN